MHRTAKTVLPFLPAALLAGGLGACAWAGQTAATDLSAEAALEAARTQSGDYRVAPQDLIEISVYQEKDLGRQVVVNRSGKISFPLVGEIELAGLTVVEAEERLRDRLRSYLVDPRVSVFIKEYHARKVFVLGEVARPGGYDIPVDRPMTVVEAIAVAGGFTRIAAPDKTRVVRNADGRSQYLTVQVSQATAGDNSKDLPLKPGDVIFVPQTFF